MSDTENKNIITIAVDGPAGAGKSSVCRALAEVFSRYFDCVHVDTGAFYRAAGLFASVRGIDIDDSDAIARSMDEFDIDVRYDGDGIQHVIICGKEVPDSDLRSESAGRAASKTSAVPRVRQALLEFQRSLARRFSVIMDGRDIGTVVLPDADAKLFITASPEIRAGRRLKQLEKKGVRNLDYDEILAGINERDRRDSTRAVSPCVPAQDGIILDTSDINEAESVRSAYGMIISRCSGKLSGYPLPSRDEISF